MLLAGQAAIKPCEPGAGAVGTNSLTERTPTQARSTRRINAANVVQASVPYSSARNAVKQGFRGCSMLAQHGTYASTAAAARMKQRTAMAAAFILTNV